MPALLGYAGVSTTQQSGHRHDMGSAAAVSRDRALESSAGADPWIGRRVPELFRQAGLVEVRVEARVQMYPPGNTRRTISAELVRAMRPQILAMGLADASELDQLDTAVRGHVTDPHTVIMSGLLFLTWGRKPR